MKALIVMYPEQGIQKSVFSRQGCKVITVYSHTEHVIICLIT